jgi:hypothetical protein
LNDKVEVVKWVLKEGGEGLEEGLGGEAAEGDAGEDEDIGDGAEDGEDGAMQDENNPSAENGDATTLLEKLQQIDIKDSALSS